MVLLLRPHRSARSTTVSGLADEAMSSRSATARSTAWIRCAGPDTTRGLGLRPDSLASGIARYRTWSSQTPHSVAHPTLTEV